MPITTSLEVSKRLKESGYPQESVFYWVVNSVIPSDTQIKLKKDCGSWKHSKKIQDSGAIKYYSAPTASELLEKLPKDSHLALFRTISGGWGVNIDNTEQTALYGGTPQDALAELYIHLIKEKIITN